MNLHRTLGKPDWQTTPYHQRSVLQHIAAVTFGVITIGNIVSVLGLALVITGCVVIIAQHYWIGSGLIIAGRLLDLADGFLAHITKTKGPVGEVVDASFDKLGTLATIITLFIAEIATWPYLLALLIPQALITIVSIYQKLKGRDIHPSLTGKLSMASLWAAIAGLLVAKATDSLALDILATVLSITAFTLGVLAGIQYARHESKSARP